MPTILFMLGWRLFFYANERTEPPHIHCKKADCEYKYWIDIENYEIIEAYAYSLSPKERREIKKIIYQHLEYIVAEWNKFQEGEHE